VTLPDSSRAWSSNASTSRCMSRALRSIGSISSACSGAVLASSEANPPIEVSGVRSSWAAVLRNSSLSTSRRRSSALASCSSCSAFRSDASTLVSRSRAVVSTRRRPRCRTGTRVSSTWPCMPSCLARSSLRPVTGSPRRDRSRSSCTNGLSANASPSDIPLASVAAGASTWAAARFQVTARPSRSRRTMPSELASMSSRRCAVRASSGGASACGTEVGVSEFIGQQMAGPPATATARQQFTSGSLRWTAQNATPIRCGAQDIHAYGEPGPGGRPCSRAQCSRAQCSHAQGSRAQGSGVGTLPVVCRLLLAPATLPTGLAHGSS
jgi:hypothetical protein